MKMHPSDPLAPVRVAALITSIKGRLNVPYSTLERYAGPAYNTIHGWAAGTPAVQVEAVLRLLARLPASERHQLVDNACPCFPSLSHPFLARDRLISAQLTRLLEQTHGTTLVAGSSDHSDYLTSFVATALGHSFAVERAKDGRIGGVDAHEVDWSVPVPGVAYIGLNPDAASIRAQAQRQQESHFTKFFLFNRVCARFPVLRAAAQSLSQRAHLVLAEPHPPGRILEGFAPPWHVVTVQLDRQQAEREDDAAHMLVQVREVASATKGSR
jgi:hypothetical protein